MFQDADTRHSEDAMYLSEVSTMTIYTNPRGNLKPKRPKQHPT
jgi:hypothetical protein